LSVVGLPLYDLPELEGSTDALYSALAAALRTLGIGDVPAALTRGCSALALLGEPGLLLAQVCGYPLATRWAAELEVVATPCYRAQGCSGPSYRSLLVVGAAAPFECLDALRGAVCAFNAPDSHSGMNALRAHLAPRAGGAAFFGEVRESGSHRESLELVACGGADVAAIDCITYALLSDVAPGLVAQTRVLESTAPAPAPPFVTRRGGPVAALRKALDRVLADPALTTVRGALRLQGCESLPGNTYAHFTALRDGSARLGYPSLR
jgi:ABC-type phosphate/phosphonate transport system substrate-binding protein